MLKQVRFLNVSLSGYYFRQLVHPDREVATTVYRKQIHDLFTEYRATYDSGRMCELLRACGYRASYRKVQRIMNDEKLVSIHCRRCRQPLTDSKKSRDEGFVNLTNGMEFTVPFQLLFSDISYIRTDEGFE